VKWIGQHIFDLISRFRGKVYFEDDIEVKADNITFESDTADSPTVVIKNTKADDSQAARLQITKDRGAAGQNGDNAGEIEFRSYNNATPPEEIIYGTIIGEIHDATDGEESGAMYLSVASHDGGRNAGLKMFGGSLDNEVDIEIGRGAASVTDIQGTLSMGGTAAMTNAGLLSVANQSGITGLGTISSGVWQGSKITSTYLDDDTAHLSGTQTFSGAKTFSAAGTFSDNLTVNGTTSFTSASAGRPIVEIRNTGNNTLGGVFQFVLDKGAVGADNDLPGGIQWISDNDAGTQEQIAFGQLYTIVADAHDANEAGAMFFKVAEYDGTLSTGLKIDGNTDADGEIDVTIGAGAASITSIAGALEVTSSITVDDINLNAKTITITGDTDDTCSIVTGASGATDITTVDTNAAAGHLSLVPDGDVRFKPKTGSFRFMDSDNPADYLGLTIDAPGDIHWSTNDASGGNGAHYEIEAQGNIILDPTGSIELESNTTITGDLTLGGNLKKSIHVRYSSIKDAGSNMGSEKFISLADADRENVSADGVAIVAIMPATGVLKKVIINSSSTLDKEWEWKYYKIPSGTSYGSPVLMATVASNTMAASSTNKVVDFVTNTADTNVLSWASNPDGGNFDATTQFSAGDRVAFSSRCTDSVLPGASTIKINYTLVFELDESTI